MSIFRRASLVVVLLVVAAPLSIRPAFAATTVLGPTACAIASQFDGRVEITSQYFKNPGNNGRTMPVVCGLFRDNTTNTNGMQDLEVNITNLGATAFTVTCTAYSYERKGGMWKKSVPRSATVGVGTGVTLDWGSSVNISVSKGFYTVYCELPIDFAIHSIYYQEP